MRKRAKGGRKAASRSTRRPAAPALEASKPAAPINVAPEWLGAEARGEWDRRVGAIARPLSPQEADTLAAYCVEWDRWKRAEANVQAVGTLIKTASGPAPNPYLAIANKARDRLARLADRVPIPGEAADESGEELKTRREVAEALNVHMMTVTKWEREGLPIAKRGRKGRASLYSLAAIREWLLAREQARTETDGPLDPTQAKARRDHWQAILAEQTYQTRRRELLPAAEVERLWTSEIAAVRAKLLAVPVTYADRVFRAGTLEGIAGVERKLTEAIHSVLRELAGEPGAGEVEAA